jgi:hypothetical protein
MKGFPLTIDNIKDVEDGQSIGCKVEETIIDNGQYFVDQRPNARDRIATIFRFVNGVREETKAVLTLYQARMVIRKQKY